MTDEQKEKDKLFDRIMKMYRKAQSLMEMGNEAEAMTFMAGVQKTLAAHDLEMGEVEYAVMEKENPVKMHGVHMQKYGLGKKKLVQWQVLVIISCSQAHFCDVIFVSKTNSFVLIGRRHDRMVAEFMITTLIRFAETTAQKEYVKAFYKFKGIGLVEAARGFKKGFLTGFTHRICERYDELVAEMKKQAATGPGTALVRLNQSTSLVAQAKREISQEIGATEQETKSSTKDANVFGLVAGAKVADGVSLKGTGLEAGKAASKAMGAGQKLLGDGNG